MINLAGEKNALNETEKELKEAGIEKLAKIEGGEVSPQQEGKLNGFTFYRAWIYWIARGKMSLENANKLQQISKSLGPGFYGIPIRADGDCGCHEPSKYTNSWHIDTQEGLNTFVSFIKEI